MEILSVCAPMASVQHKEPAEPCWIVSFSLHETLTLTFCLRDSAQLQKMPFHPQKHGLVTLCSLQAKIALHCNSWEERVVGVCT